MTMCTQHIVLVLFDFQGMLGRSLAYLTDLCLKAPILIVFSQFDSITGPISFLYRRKRRELQLRFSYALVPDELILSLA